LSLRSFTDAYIESALWASLDSEGIPLDEYHDASDIERNTLRAMKEDAKTFYTWYSEYFGGDDKRAGYDFWLTRNGHGAGYWDGDWPEKLGLFLTEASNSFGEFVLDLGDNDKVYVVQEGTKPKRLFFEVPGHPGYQGGVIDWIPEGRKKPRRPRK
jgi:hypothetical protein